MRVHGGPDVREDEIMKRLSRLAGCTLAALAFAPAAAQDPGDSGRRAFRECQGCHTLLPDRNMTGPSLAGIFGRTAGGLASFDRYSAAMRKSGIVWNAETLDEFLADPAAVVPGNFMTFPGVSDAKSRAAVIAYLKGVPAAAGPSRPLLPSLKSLEPRRLVAALRLCGDSYFVTTGDGATKPIWEFNLRFKTNSSPEGPAPGKPAILRAGMMGDRATVVFATPSEIGRFVQVKCE